MLVRLFIVLSAVASLLQLFTPETYAQSITLKKGDHIGIIGGTVAERMQQFGWLETMLHARFPQHELVIRNLAYSGDEVELDKRLRSRDFVTPDEWLTGSAPVPQPAKLSNTKDVSSDRFALTNTKADVIFAFFGYNESFTGEAGLAAFQKNLDDLLGAMLAKQYNGKSAPQIVLFSPIAHENLRDPNLPDGSANNGRLKNYSQAMAEVAKKRNVVFIDLFTPTLANYSQGTARYTINGIHQNDAGDRAIANIIDVSLFGAAGHPAGDLTKLNQAVRDKCFYWFHRYRVTDGYSTYGDRAFLKFVEDQSNYVVGQRELEVLDVMTANREQRVWAVAQGKELKIDDSNVPGFIPVTTNKPGSLEGGKHLFLSGEQAIEKMTVGQGLKVSLFASEEQFPELINPVQMAFDPKGRLWVAAWATYPHWKPLEEEMNDKLLILEDTNNDGKADKCITFADHIHNPTGFEFWGGGVIVAMGPDIIFLKDTNGDDKADVRYSMLHGFDTADTHHTANSFTLDPGGALYFQEGTFHHSQVETPWGPPRRVANGAVFRFEPRSYKVDVYVSHSFANPHGHAFDRWGQDVVVDGTGAVPYHAALFSGNVEFPNKHVSPPRVYAQRTRPCPAIEFLSSGHFPEEWRGNLLVPNVITFQGILRYKVQDRGGSLEAIEQEPLLSSSDPNFRPADVETAPDGSVYFVDWQNPIIGHMQHNLRDPSRDKVHGRVYRVTYEGRALVPAVPVGGASIDQLIRNLDHPDDRIRYRSRIELSGRDSQTVVDAVERWRTTLDATHPENEHRLLEALWVHQHHNVVNLPLLNRVLASSDFRARAAATRVLCYWRDRIGYTLDALKKLAADPHPRVRLEAVRAASFLNVPEATEVVLIAKEQEADPFVEFVAKETMKTIEPLLKQTINQGQVVAFSTDAGRRFLLKSMNLPTLLAQPRNLLVYQELLFRTGLRDEQRQEAVRGLSQLQNKSELRIVIDAIHQLDQQGASTEPSLVFDLVRLLTGRQAGELGQVRDEIQKLALSAKQAAFRQIGFVSLMTIDGSIEPAWKLCLGSIANLRDFIDAMPLISDSGLQAALYDRIEPIAHEVPATVPGNRTQGVQGRFVRIELTGRRTLTLAEVEIFSGGRNIARNGKATQSNTGAGGVAARAIDGNISGSFGDGGQTHTEESTPNPFWEVDLGGVFPIDKIIIYNRTDGALGKRLENFSLQVLDGRRAATFKKENNAAPDPSVTFSLEGAGPEFAVRQAAMVALTYVRGQEAKTFATLSRYLNDDVYRVPAVRALQRLPVVTWPAKEATALVPAMMASLRKIPENLRTSAAALDQFEFTGNLVNTLPTEQAAPLRKELDELGVKVIRLGTIFERMSFDKDVIAVKAGKRVEFILENTDLMPHNFVILKPGTLEDVGMYAEANSQNPAFATRQFVPDLPSVIAGSRLLQPRESQNLSVEIPSKPGVYPFVCTYPGHWRRMHGALYVVDDMNAYLASPETYLAAAKVEPVDPLLKERRPRTEWKVEDVQQFLGEFKGRSHSTGKQMFKVANCIGCHKLEGVGNEFGPDLTKYDQKWTPADLVKDVVDPSSRIHEKYQGYIFELKNGKTVTGLILEENATEVKLIENPLVSTKPTIVAIAEIEERVKAKVSLMPKGLLDKLTRDEILDLLAYLYSRTDKNHAVFKGDGHDHK